MTERLESGDCIENFQLQRTPALHRESRPLDPRAMLSKTSLPQSLEVELTLYDSTSQAIQI